MTPPRSAFGAPPLGGAAGGPAEPDPRQPPDPIHRSVALGAFALVLCMLAAPAHAANAAAAASVMPWWVWVLALFVVCFLIGIVAVPAGIGGGTLFVPIIGGFFPFHLDFVRGAGLLVALASALAAAPLLLRSGLASLRLGLPLAVLASASSIGGAVLGLALPPAAVQIALGVIVLGIVALMLGARKSEIPQVREPDALSAALHMNGVFVDGASGQRIDWKVHRTPLGLALFLCIGVLAGMFGIGAGWANVPALNLLMGAPLKVSAGTSGLVLSLVDSSAAWVYLNHGAVMPIIAVPSVIGMMLGARIGARLLGVLKGAVIRRMVIALLLFAGLRALLKGMGVWP
ncbi:MAG: sulfite exporter TauE/SafE family protein [Piscinibacter sp.]|nr:sulfite exporter TauE/SafE family protein [Piscinibacter sp.]